MARNRRSRCNELILFSENSSLGWRGLRRISFDDGERSVNHGTMRRVYDELGNQIGYQFCAAAPVPTGGSSQPSCVVISNRERELIAFTRFQGSGSETAGMSEARRLERMKQTDPRTGKLLPAEDAVERAMEKLKLYPKLAGELAWRQDVRKQIAKSRAAGS